jgi:hypothetical protein
MVIFFGQRSPISVFGANSRKFLRSDEFLLWKSQTTGHCIGPRRKKKTHKIIESTALRVVTPNNTCYAGGMSGASSGMRYVVHCNVHSFVVINSFENFRTRLREALILNELFSLWELYSCTFVYQVRVFLD